ncbi:MAG: tetratricopeptide repeat protein [Bacteroidales bacterium]|nr:tetratricopeptide repeat protein [Bacteroidales bacterium]
MKERFFYIIWIGVAVVMAFPGCSTEKNTGITRTYHNVTTRFNVLFNARESYKSGIKKAEQSDQDDYTQMLPLFLYGNEAVAQAVSGDMETAAKKATKAANLHSIKVKPKVGKSGMSPAEKKFYDKREFNKYISDCYMIIGKSYVYTNQYFQALQTFNFMETEFPGEKSLYEARLWRAKALILDKNLAEAGRVLAELREDKDFPNGKALRSELNATTADWHIRQKHYAGAVEYLNRALRDTRHKKTKMRYSYVLAQLYLEQKDYAQASAMFRKVIRMNPSYEMSFNATISRATASKSSGADIRDVKKQLNRMLRDSKNTEYQDQIYYALAEIELYEGNTDKAIEYFRKSAQASTGNLPQKTKSYLTLANLFYDRREYIPAQAYYDSAIVNMQPTYPDYVQIAAKAKNLDALVYNLNTVHFQDSVQRIARMSDAERNRLISGIISELQLKEQREKEAEAARLQQYYSNIGRRTTLSDPTSKTQWYFYNPTTVSQGIGEFQVKWGRRSLEDNWRRKNKGTVEIAMAAESVDDNAPVAGDQKIQDVHTPGYYLQNIPLTDSMMRASDRMIEESLYAAGYIYNNDFEEYAPAAAQYEDLIRRYPQSDYVVPSYYYLYQLYNKQGKAAEAEKYKSLLLAKAPESIYARIILDPTYLDKLAQQKGESEQLYEQTYDRYNRGEYQSVINLASDAMERFPKDALAPKFAYLKAISAGKLAGTNEAMRTEMKTIATDYPESDIAAEAQNLIDFIDGKDPAMKQADRVERAKSMYAYSETGAYYFGWMVDSKENINQLSFDVLNFNLDHFIDVKLEVVRNNIDDKHVLLMVTGFTDLQRAQGYYRTFVMEPGLMKNVKYEYSNFLISESNYAILEQDRKIEDYIEFFKKEYLKQ